MKKQNLLFIISIVFVMGLMSCATQNKIIDSSMRQVKYISGIIHSVDRNVVELSDGSKWRLNRFLVTSNMSEVLIVLYEDRLQGFMYVNGIKYFLEPQAQSLSIDIDTNVDYLTKKNSGYLTIIKSIDMNIGTITLFGGTEWRISGYYQNVVKDWREGSDIIISDDYTWAINLETYTKAEIKLLTSRL